MATPAKEGMTRKYTSRRDHQLAYEDSDEEDGGGKGGGSYLDTSVIQVKATDGSSRAVVGNEKFNNYKKIFTNLLKHNSVVTQHPIVSMNIAHDSSRVTTVTKAGDHEYWINMFSLVDFKNTFRERIGGKES